MIMMDRKVKMQKRLGLEIGYSMKPKDGSDGEDSVYVGDNLIAIMDGVSSWKLKGINPKLYS